MSEGEYIGDGPQYLERGRSGRMPYHQFAGSGNVFSAVPPADGPFRTGNVNRCGDEPDNPSDDTVIPLVVFHSALTLNALLFEKAVELVSYIAYIVLVGNVVSGAKRR